MTHHRWFSAIALTLFTGLVLAGCGLGDPGSTERKKDHLERASAEQGKFFGDIFEFGPDSSTGSEGTGVAVNSYLWRASLDTISFFPIASADPFGGVIITDWYSLPEAPDERYKLNVYILGRELRADGVRVAAFRQTRSGNGWDDAPVAADTAAKLENAILTRARQIRVNTQAQFNE